MNFVFISPDFPDHYYRFCQGLKNNGVQVFGIIEGNDANVSPELRNALTAWYCVTSLHDMDEKIKAIHYFEAHYGKIDFIESNNEYWLMDDAHLRTVFSVKTGPQDKDIDVIKFKSKMKAAYHKAEIPVARYALYENLQQAIDFAAKVGYPIVIKPDNGVGASETHKVRNEEELRALEPSLQDTTYIMEEFVKGELISFDGLCDSKGNVVYPTHHVFPDQIMDVVNAHSDVMYYTAKEIPPAVLKAGQAVVKAFGAKSRFFHLEFFVLSEDHMGLGKKGDIVGLEVNMRAPGGYTPDMINFAYSIDIYQLWADVIAFDALKHEYKGPRSYCCYVGRRFHQNYAHSFDEVARNYVGHIKWIANNPPIIAGAMGDYFIMADFDTVKELESFTKFVLER